MQELLEKYEALEKGQREWHERCQQTCKLEHKSVKIVRDKLYDMTVAGERAKLSEAEEQFQLAQQDLEVAKSKVMPFCLW